jgi:hypothetical protein
VAVPDEGVRDHGALPSVVVRGLPVSVEALRARAGGLHRRLRAAEAEVPARVGDRDLQRRTGHRGLSSSATQPGTVLFALPAVAASPAPHHVRAVAGYGQPVHRCARVPRAGLRQRGAQQPRSVRLPLARLEYRQQPPRPYRGDNVGRQPTALHRDAPVLVAAAGQPAPAGGSLRAAAPRPGRPCGGGALRDASHRPRTRWRGNDSAGPERAADADRHREQRPQGAAQPVLVSAARLRGVHWRRPDQQGHPGPARGRTEIRDPRRHATQPGNRRSAPDPAAMVAFPPSAVGGSPAPTQRQVRANPSRRNPGVPGTEPAPRRRPRSSRPAVRRRDRRR